jgi:small subunit ribosomal protein S16
MVGEPVWLEQKNGHKFLALNTEAKNARGAAIVAHGRGWGLDYELYGTLRSKLAEADCTTLSIQLPLSAFSACKTSENRLRIAGFAYGGGQMVVIRLARGGAKKRPFFNVVVADSRRARDGRFIERLGFYDPKAPAGHESLRISMDRVQHWQGQGAKISDTVARLVKQFSAGQAGAVQPTQS